MKLKTLPMCLLACAISTVFAAGAQAEEKKSIVTVVKVTGINWFTRMEEGVKEFAKANPDINASQTGPGRADAAQQLKIVQDLVAKNVSALAIVPFDPPTLEPILARAKSRGIKIVTHEADNLKNTDYDLEAFKNNEYGADLNERLAKCMTNKGEWAVLVGSLGSRSQVQWAQGGIDNAKAKYPDLKLVTTMQETNNDGEKAYQVAQQLLRKYPNLAGFQGSSSLDVIGIGRAVEEAGKAGKICVFGTGLPGEAGPYMEKDAITGIAFWDPKDAGMAMNNVAKMLLEGKTIENGTDLGVPGYEKVTVEKGPGKGMIIRGAGWVRVDKSNYKQYNF